MQRRIDLIGVASGLGGVDADCARAPAHLADAGLVTHLRRAGVDAQWAATLAPVRHGRGSAQTVAQLCERLAATVAASLRGGRLPCVIGGDHSCAAGTWMGVARALQPRGRLGLVWVDAHMDAHTPGTSPSGRLHGMPLAALLGQCDHPLEGLDEGVIAARHICLVGVRSHEPEEAGLLRQRGVTVFGMDEILRRGLASVLGDALAVAREGTAGYGVTIDLDALDPVDAPAVATPVQGGIRGSELVHELARVAREERFAAFEIAEFCPRRDRDRRTERLILRILAAALGGSAEDSEIVPDALHTA